MIQTSHESNNPSDTNVKSADNDNILSASGSKNFPQRDEYPNLRATHPSYQSVSAAIR